MSEAPPTESIITEFLLNLASILPCTSFILLSASDIGLYISIAIELLSKVFAKLKGKRIFGIIAITPAESIGTPIDFIYIGVMKMLSTSIVAVVVAIAVINPARAPFRVRHFLYMRDAHSEKVADETKFIINPYQPVVLKVRNSINDAIKAIATAEVGPYTKDAIAITASLASSERNPPTGGITLHTKETTTASDEKIAIPAILCV